jgi:hypothetical protein
MRVAAVALALSLVTSAFGSPSQPVLADTGDLSIAKTTNASDVQSPGDSFRYTITVNAHAALEDLVVADGAFDYPQIAITSASYSVNGVSRGCGDRPDNMWCRVGNVPAGTTVVATVNVRVNEVVNVACDKPDQHGTLDNTLYNIARARWMQGGTSLTKETSRVTVKLNCEGYDGTALPPPTVSITSGPSGSVTSTSATFTFAASPAASSFRCALDGGSLTTCASPKTYTNLSVGSHFFDVQGVNATGAGVPARRSWTVANPFTDIGSSAFRADILWLYSAGITAGCTATKFCPLSVVTREQMASFLVRALKLPATNRDFFTDDETSGHEADINRLAASGITAGCAPGRFCPRAGVTREQMASFLARAFELATSSTDYFSDDNTSIHEGDINRLAKSGITGGCAAGKYCPRASVTREQMAAFLHRALTR